MAISLSTLTLTQRSLSIGAPASSRALLARDLATRFIKQQGSQQAACDAIDFLRECAPVELKWFDDALSFSIPRDSLNKETIPPPPYGLKGGAARELAMPAMGIRQPRTPRDIDLIRKGAFNIASDVEMAKQWMSRDYLHGARVELIRDTNKYLSSRDLTINEISVFNLEATASILSALDAVGCVFRPSRYRGGSIHKHPSLDGRVVLKMVRLAAEATQSGETATLVGIPDEISFSDFDLAVHLNKSFQRGAAVAQEYAHILTMLGILSASSDPLAAILAELAHFRLGERGILPDVPAEYFSFKPSADEY